MLEDPLGQEISHLGEDPSQAQAYRVIGVVRDFHFSSFGIRSNPGFALRRQQRVPRHEGQYGDIQAPWLHRLKNASGMPSLPTSPSDTTSWMMISMPCTIPRCASVPHRLPLFTFLAVFIACLVYWYGLYTAERRTKEIGIRKVLGAPYRTVFLLLAKEFTRWVVPSPVSSRCPWFIHHAKLARGL